METISYETIIIIAGIIQGVLIVLFVCMFFYLRTISKESKKQTKILFSLADKQGAIITKKCPYCEKEIIFTLLNNDRI